MSSLLNAVAIAAEETGTTSTMTDILTTLGTVVTQMFTWVGSAFDIISEHPIALIWVGSALAFTAVKFTKYILGL